MEDLLDRLRSFDGIIIVEGRKDITALKRHGIPAEEINGPIIFFCERIAQREPRRVLLLTDQDTQGRKLRSALKDAFSRLGIEEDAGLRAAFYAQTRISHVEGLDI